MRHHSEYHTREKREHIGKRETMNGRIGHVVFLYVKGSDDPVIGRLARASDQICIKSGSKKYDLTTGSTVIIPCYENGVTEFHYLNV